MDTTANSSWRNASLEVPDEVMVNPFIFWQFRAAIATINYGINVINPLGIIGNILVILVLGLRGRRLMSTHIYLINLAVSDLGFCINQLVRGIPCFINVDVTYLNAWVCRLWYVFNVQTLVQSNWTVMAVTLERCFVVYLPLKAKQICTKKRALMAYLRDIQIGNIQGHSTCPFWGTFILFKQLV